MKHYGHEIGPEVYSSYSFTKKLTQEDIEFVLLMAKAGAPPMKIVQILSSRTGSSYKSKDIRNLLVKLRSRVRDGDTLEKELEAVIKDGGTVRYGKDPNTNFVDPNSTNE